MEPICLGYSKDDTLTACYGCSWYLPKGLCKHPSFFRCIEFIRSNEPSLSYSSMQTFICPRKFWFHYIVGYEAIEKPLPMRLGGLCSKVLDKLHSKKLNLGKVKISDLIFEELKEWGVDVNGYYPYQVEALLSVLQAYVDMDKHAEKGSTQQHFTWREEGLPEVNGYCDNIQYEGYIGWEYKYTQKPDAYTRFTLQDQLSTYFLGFPKIQRFTVRTFLNPIGTIKLSKNESISIYRDRVFQDVLVRPRHYFQDQSYFRSEFDLEAHKIKLRCIANDILRYIEFGGGHMLSFRQVNTPYTCFLQSEAGSPSPCEYLPICETGVISETLFKRRAGKVIGPREENGKIIVKGENDNEDVR